MSSSRLPVVYLDTQDYSRFGDVLRGKSDHATERVFDELVQRKEAGKAVSALSMPIVSELLQYDAAFRDTTLKKAEAVERLCGPNALIAPSRVLKAEIARVATEHGLVSGHEVPPVISRERYWYPNVSEVFHGLDTMLRDALETQAASIRTQNRKQKRVMGSELRRFDASKAARHAEQEIARKFDLPTEVVNRAIVGYLDKKVSAEEASRLLFGGIAEPTRFVETYFERVQSNRGLPRWIGDASKELQENLLKLRDSFPFVPTDRKARAEMLAGIESRADQIGRTILKAADDNTEEFGVTRLVQEKFLGDENLSNKVTACRVVGRIGCAYLGQILGLTAADATVEESFGGDLVHALYLPHVDLWRGDRRFANVVIEALPDFRDRVVRRLADLPGAIDAWVDRGSVK